MSQHARASWSDQTSHPPTVAVPLTPVEDELQAYLAAIAKSLGSGDASLTLHPERGEGEPFRAAMLASGGIPEEVHDRLSTLGGTSTGARSWNLGQGDVEWLSCIVEDSAWHVLRLPVWSLRAKSRLILNLFFASASLADRARIMSKLQVQRAMIEAYLRLWQRMRAKTRSSDGFRCALDCVETGILLIDRHSRIAFANKAAGEILAAGELLRLSGESFTASDLRQAVTLQVALSHALAANLNPEEACGSRSAPILSLRSQRSGRSLVLTVVPAQDRATEHHDVAVVVYMIDPGVDQSPQLRPVCGLFGLSPVETRLVCLMVGGKTLQEASQAMRIKEQTARSYLKQIFLKTDTNRQAELVRLMLSCLLRMERTIQPAALHLTQ